MEKRTTPVTDRGGWKGIDLRNREVEWAYRFNGVDIDELECVCASVQHASTLDFHPGLLSESEAGTVR